MPFSDFRKKLTFCPLFVAKPAAQYSTPASAHLYSVRVSPFGSTAWIAVLEQAALAGEADALWDALWDALAEWDAERLPEAEGEGLDDELPEEQPATAARPRPTTGTNTLSFFTFDDIRVLLRSQSPSTAAATHGPPGRIVAQPNRPCRESTGPVAARRAKIMWPLACLSVISQQATGQNGCLST